MCLSSVICHRTCTVHSKINQSHHQNQTHRPLTETSHQRTINQQSAINSHDISSNQCLPPSRAWLLPSGRSPGPNPLKKLQLLCTRESPGSQLNKSKKEVSEPDPWHFWSVPKLDVHDLGTASVIWNPNKKPGPGDEPSHLSRCKETGKLPSNQEMHMRIIHKFLEKKNWKYQTFTRLNLFFVLFFWKGSHKNESALRLHGNLLTTSWPLSLLPRCCSLSRNEAGQRTPPRGALSVFPRQLALPQHLLSLR